MLKLKLQYSGQLMQRADSFEKTMMQEEKGTTEDEMVGWHHRLNGHGFGWTQGVGDGRGGLVGCSPWGQKESDMTEGLNLLGLACTEVEQCSRDLSHQRFTKGLDHKDVTVWS